MPARVPFHDRVSREKNGMRIRNVELAGVIAVPGAPPPLRLPQIVFSGRSNVGKSSLINRLLGRTRKGVARVSATPGKTQQINFYRVDASLAGGRERSFLLVDLPGYGYARVPDRVRGSWQPLIESYLSSSRSLAGVVQLIDMRHDPTALDLQMLEYLATLGVPVLVVLTKADKLGASARRTQAAELTAKLGVPVDQVITFSAVTGEGRDQLLRSVAALLTEVVA
jgi:GTP-binding protein